MLEAPYYTYSVMYPKPRVKPRVLVIRTTWDVSAESLLGASEVGRAYANIDTSRNT